MYASFLGHVNPEYSLAIVEIILLLPFVIGFSLEIVHKRLKTHVSATKFYVRFYIRVVTVFASDRLYFCIKCNSSTHSPVLNSALW